MKDIDWRFLAFDEFTLHELYDMLQLRSEVFVVEQACVFQDIDGVDQQAMHLLGRVDGKLVAYVRCFGPGITFAEASIGRVITARSWRGGGTGHVLMRQAVASLEGHWGPQPIRIGAQAHLEKFYRQHGFVDTGIAYIEDGIPHIEMLRAA